ncbi:MAG: hypothetical protein ACXWPP_23260 [Ktedonobacteraceae bacterium]
MSDYETILKDIEETFGIVPGFMKALPQDVLATTGHCGRNTA